MKGAQARLGGQPADSCPYARDDRKTWRNAYRKAWLRGWKSVPDRPGS